MDNFKKFDTLLAFTAAIFLTICYVKTRDQQVYNLTALVWGGYLGLSQSPKKSSEA